MKKITVKELIEMLNEMSEDAIVVTTMDEGDVAPIYEVYEEDGLVYINTL